MIIKKISSFLYNFVFLILAMFFLYLASGDKPIEIAVWLSPIFLLRYFRKTKLWKAIVFTLPIMFSIVFFTEKAMLPLPTQIAIIFFASNALISLLPFIADNLFSRMLPDSIKSLLFPSVAIAIESYIASMFTGGTWGNPAYGIRNFPILQFASVAGIWGIMFIIYWTASIINEAWEHRFESLVFFKHIKTYGIIMIIIYGFGLWRSNHEPASSESVRVAAVTPGPGYRAEMMKIIGSIFKASRTGKFDPAQLKTTFEIKFHQLLSKSENLAKSGIEIVTWSEVAAFIFYSNEEIYLKQAIKSAKEYNYHIGLGIGVIQDSCVSLIRKNQPFIENKLILISPDGNILWDYSKSNLAPGYEKIMTVRGDGILRSASTVHGEITGAICYDMDFPDYIRQASIMQSDLLLAPSNDWLEIKNTHAKMEQLRAIENGVSILRPTSSGISVAYDAYGNIISKVDYFLSQGSPLIAVLTLDSVFTLYSVIGDSFKWLCAFGAILLIVLSCVCKINENLKSIKTG